MAFTVKDFWNYTPTSSTNGEMLLLVAIPAGANDYSLRNITKNDLLGTIGVQPIIIACSDEYSDLEEGTAVVTFRMPFAFALTDIRASVGTAPTGDNIIVDVTQDGTSILSAKLVIDAGQKVSTTSTTQAAISNPDLLDFSEIKIDIDQVGSTDTGKGLKVYFIGYKAT